MAQPYIISSAIGWITAAGPPRQPRACTRRARGRQTRVALREHRLNSGSLPGGRPPSPCWSRARVSRRYGGASSSSSVAAAAAAQGENISVAGAAPAGRKVAVVVVDHGSRRQESNAMLEQFTEVFRLNTDYDIVELAHMEIAEPSILQAVRKCAELGAETVVIAPYFLSRGRHIQTDIPDIVEEARAMLPEIECIIADPIGVDPLMAKLIEKRVATALGERV